MNSWDQKIEEINNIIIKGAEGKDFDKIKQGIVELKNLLNNISKGIKEELEYTTDAENPFVAQFIPYLEKINGVLQNFLVLIEMGSLSEQDLEKLKELENELQEIIESVETIMEIAEIEDEENDEVNIEEEFEKIMNDENYEDEEEDFELESTGDKYMDSIISKINEAIGEGDEQKLVEEIDKMTKYINRPIEEEE